jgi:hypothetical protein
MASIFISLSIRGTVYPPNNDQSVAARTVETLDDLNEWCQDAVFYILNIGLETLGSYDNIQDLDKLFNDNPEEILVGCSYLLSRAEKAIIIAKLCQNPMLPKLIDKYRAMLIEQDILLTYEDVVNFISNYQPEELQQLTM